MFVDTEKYRMKRHKAIGHKANYDDNNYDDGLEICIIIIGILSFCFCYCVDRMITFHMFSLHCPLNCLLMKMLNVDNVFVLFMTVENVG